MQQESKMKILLVEPFYGGSHKQLLNLLNKHIPDCQMVTMSAKKWHWRARTAALHLSQAIPQDDDYRVLFCSSVLNLAELVALRPDLVKLKKVVYFHENQLVYPIRVVKETDFQNGYNQILSSLVADVVLFNSQYNMESFLSSINRFLKIIPDYRTKHLADQIRPKCQTRYFPLDFDEIDLSLNGDEPLLNRSISPDYMLQHGSKSDTNLSQSHSAHSVSDHSCAALRENSFTTTHSASLENIDEDVFQASPDNKEKTIEMTVNTRVDGGSSICTNDKQLTNISCDEDIDMCSSCDNVGPSTKLAKLDSDTGNREGFRPLHIVWAHRWEHDKDPETFLNTMIQIHNDNIDFRLSVIGEQFTEVPEIFGKAKDILSPKILHWGYVEEKRAYYRVIKDADIAVSTALHEFFGVAMLEAVYLGCYPLCPNRLVYPEIYEKVYLYNTPTQLYKRLKTYCRHPHHIRNHKVQIDIQQYSTKALMGRYIQILK